MMLSERKIVIDPITRLEGHGKIAVFLDDEGNVTRAYFQIPELRGFEKFLEGRAVEYAPQITSRICGVCPWAHHMAATKALDDLYEVDPPEAAKKIRELSYNIFMLEDHALHFFYLGGPDFIVGPKAPKEERNILGVLGKVGKEVGLRVIEMRRKLRELNTSIGGKVIHPVLGLPGGVSKPIDEETASKIKEVANEAVEFSDLTLKLFREIVLSKDEYVELIRSEAYTHETYYMGLVDDKNRVNFYDGKIRVIRPNGREYVKFEVKDYEKHIAEHVEPWTYVKFPYLRGVGWNGFTDGEKSGIFSVAPLARLNVADGMATPKAQEAYEEMFETLGKPAHHTLANHWARVIEMVYAAERIKELSEDPELTSEKVREIPTSVPREGFGVVEAPRGTLIHHYITDERGIIKRANLLVATQHNAARISLSIDKAAKSFIRRGEVDEGILNMIEMAFRAYDPCHACATHSLPGEMPLTIELMSEDGEKIGELTRG